VTGANESSERRIVSRRPLRVEELDSRHVRILHLLALDATMPTIAAELFMTTDGVKYHVDRLRGLFGVKSRAALIAAGFVFGLLATGQGTVEAGALDNVTSLDSEGF
jgi:DNA-binding NarL/FixJ family response regulator